MISIPKYFKGDAHPVSITLVGMGGTGTSVLTHLARIHVGLQAKGKQGLLVTAVDADTVSEANMGRQVFTANDLGKSKAAALVERVNRFYGTSWLAIPENFGLDIAYLDPFPGNIFISCVDNVKARKDINRYIYNNQQKEMKEEIKNRYWIDTGNSVDKGQVIMGSREDRLKTVIDIYPDMQKHEKRDTTPSCSLAEALDKQDLFINTMVAHVTAQLVWDICTKPVVDWAGAYININKQTPIVKVKA